MPRMSPLLEKVYRKRGLDPAIVSSFDQLENQAVEQIEAILRPYPKAETVYRRLTADPTVRAHWEMANYMTVVKLSYNDHGETHAKIATAYALNILRLLLQAGKQPDVVSDGLGDEDDAMLVVTAATLLHDIGNQAGRLDHEMVSVSLAGPLLERVLEDVYPDLARRTTMAACVSHAILAHDLNSPPLTLEAAIVAVGDGADLTQGRGRVAYDLGKVDIHSVSALAVKSVTILPGQSLPVEIAITMSNSAGIFQVEQTLARKLLSTELKELVTITATVQPDGERPLFERLTLRQGRFVAESQDEG